MSSLSRKRNLGLLATAVSASAIAAVPAEAQTTTSQTSTQAQRPVQEMSTVAPSWERIRTFGDINPLWERIRTFGSIEPSEAELTAFWGRIRSFTNPDGTVSTPDWNAILAFQSDIVAHWERIRTFWDFAAVSNAPADYSALNQDLNALIARSEAEYGAAVQSRTGRSFNEAFAAPILSRFGIDLNDPASLARLDRGTREEFFVVWFDNLMQYSGTDQIDHWMRTVNWRPALTQDLGEGRDARIGILDFTLTGSEARNVVVSGGVSTYTNGHGSAVAGLMVAPHDGVGVMGIAPNASVISYNPFDASGTADWSDITRGVLMLTRNGATIINMSLGVPGWTFNPGWRQVFSANDIRNEGRNSVYVIAAGNEGVRQTANVEMNGALDSAFLVVGSVDLNNNISAFSNGPGTACLTDGGQCGNTSPYSPTDPRFATSRYLQESGLLMNRFIVAPGEFILVSDGNGGVMRASGTSFAAPIVAGAIALIHDRWPWLADRPYDTVNLILRSARDLGAPGTDPIYGRGLLDVEAALSPANFDELKWFQNTNGRQTATSASKILSTSASTRATWEANGVYFSVFEDTGTSKRDFAIPLSARLLGQSVGKSGEQFNSYLQSRFLEWLNGQRTSGFNGTGGFTDVGHFHAAYTGSGNIDVAMAFTPRVRRMGFRDSDRPFDAAFSFASPDRGFALQVGTGEAGVALGGQTGFTMRSDHDPDVGGANPFLGLASGGGYIRFDVALSPRWTLSTGFATRSTERDLEALPMQDRPYFASFGPYQAGAGNVSVTYRPTPELSVSASYTRLQEENAVLGMQSLDPNDFRDGSSTDAATVSAEFEVVSRLRIAASATVARTTTSDDPEQNIRLADGGMPSTAFQVGVTRDGVFGRHDRLRLSVAQPMHAESSRIDFTQVRVIDRNTGEIGEVTDSFVVPDQERRYMAELIYAAPLLDGGGELSLFGRAQLAGEEDRGTAGILAGARLRIGF